MTSFIFPIVFSHRCMNWKGDLRHRSTCLHLSASRWPWVSGSPPPRWKYGSRITGTSTSDNRKTGKRWRLPVRRRAVVDSPTAVLVTNITLAHPPAPQPPRLLHRQERWRCQFSLGTGSLRRIQETEVAEDRLDRPRRLHPCRHHRLFSDITISIWAAAAWGRLLGVPPCTLLAPSTRTVSHITTITTTSSAHRRRTLQLPWHPMVWTSRLCPTTACTTVWDTPQEQSMATPLPLQLRI